MIYCIIFLFSAFLVIAIVPSIIYVANQKLLFDDSHSGRKIHTSSISRFGGVAIFCSFMISCLLFSQITNYAECSFILASCMILFVVGLKDDFWGVNPSTKFGAQLIAAIIMVVLANIRLTSLYGMFNIYDMSYPFSLSISILIIIFIINAFNLIDGIDGLAATIGGLVNISLGLMFLSMNEMSLACIALAIAGTCIGFLRFNLVSAKIFMGDTGALLIGFISIVLALKFVEINKTGLYKTSSLAPSIAVALFIIPVFDTIRIFILRILKGNSPFIGDRNHIHHRMLNAGFSHVQTTFILAIFSLAMILLVFQLKSFNNVLMICVIFMVCIICNTLLTIVIKKKGFPDLERPSIESASNP
jgi:UDP-GlcNAc:undecaprenyl-phosphate GlcNAc-1-phosphate transferase